MLWILIQNTKDNGEIKEADIQLRWLKRIIWDTGKRKEILEIYGEVGDIWKIRRYMEN